MCKRLFLVLWLVFGICQVQNLHAAELEPFTNSLRMDMIPIPAGTFRMGATGGDADYDEKPVHNVTITQPFHMSMTEVTNAQYERFDPTHAQIDHEGFGHGPTEAVIFVTWEDAVAFCEWLSQEEGRPYRLPTEAEWEYACRAGTTTEFFTGNSLSSAYYNEQNQSRTDGPEPRSLYVGTAQPNAFGLHDMHGNVEEWCYDWFGPYEAGDQIDPVGRENAIFKVTRGGSHSTQTRFLRSANRLGTIPIDKHWLIGFRVVVGELPATDPLPEYKEPYQRNVEQGIPGDIKKGPDHMVPYFKRRQYVRIPPGADGPAFSDTNHVSAIVECPNGDLLAAWYSGNSETRREDHAAICSRLRWHSDEWELASGFWDAPDRNDHTTSFWKDEKGTIYHFQGIADALFSHCAACLRTSDDSGVTWKHAWWITPEHGSYGHVEATIFRGSDGVIYAPFDRGGGTRIRYSPDDGRTWYITHGDRILGNHGAFVELKDGSFMAFSRAKSGNTPMQFSYDKGQNWTEAVDSIFRYVGSGRRLSMTRLKDGSIFIATYGTIGSTYLTAALSYDEGQTWPYMKIMTDGSGDRVETRDGATFTMDDDTAEKTGYNAIWQARNQLVHVVTSRQHYAFNMKWLNPDYIHVAEPEADFNLDGVVNFIDFAIIIQGLGDSQ